MNYFEYWRDVFDSQIEYIKNAELVVLYGKTTIEPMIRVAVRTINDTCQIVMFDKGRFDKDGINPHEYRAVSILCGMKKRTRDSMSRDIQQMQWDFPFFDFFALYYHWITTVIKRDCGYEELGKTLYDIENDIGISNLDVINTTFCDLKCRDCSNGIQFRKEREFIAASNNLSFLNKIAEKTPIAYCNIQGGEALLDKEFSDLLMGISKNPNIAFITVATNGTILPDTDVLETMSRTGAIIRISDYGDLSKNKDSILSKCEEYTIPCTLYERAKSWKIYGDIVEHNRSISENQNISSSCLFGTNCIMLYKGALFCCCRTLYMQAKGMNSVELDNNILKLDSDFSQQDLLDLIQGRKLHQICDYCDFPMKEVEPAIQIK